MKYTYERKLQLVAAVKSGTPISVLARENGIDKRDMRRWVRLYERHGEGGLKRAATAFTEEFRGRMVRLVLEKGVPLSQISIDYRVSRACIGGWVRKVLSEGYASLGGRRTGDRTAQRDMGRPKKREPQTETEKLQAEVLRLNAELALLKKVIALVEEKEAQERKNGQRPSTN